MGRTRSALVVALVVLLGGAGFWLTRPPKSEHANERRRSAHDPTPEHAEPAKRTIPPEQQTIPASVPPAPAPPPAPRSHAGEVVGAHPHAPHLPGMLPHPEGDPARERLHSENRLIQTLNDAMSFRRVDEMRALLAEYKKLDPSDVHSNQAGYAVIIDCIESRGDASLAAAHEFYDNERHSPLRRFVRRICFENTN
jgi:hypothetical protein